MPLTVGSVLHLQRTIGNRAVSRWLARHRTPAMAERTDGGRRRAAPLTLGMRRRPSLPGPRGAPVMRALRIRGNKSPDEAQTLVDYLARATGLPLTLDASSGAVGLGGQVQPEKLRGLARDLWAIISDEERTASVIVGRGLPNVTIGDFPIDTWQEEGPASQAQRINLDHIEAIEGAVRGIGVALAAHEIYENYVAQAHRHKTGRAAKNVGHAAGVELESRVADELAGAGKRLTEDIDMIGHQEIIKPGDSRHDEALFGAVQYLKTPALIRYEKREVLFDMYTQQRSGRVKFANVRSRAAPKEPAARNEKCIVC
jgi:hypothetical protein